MNKKIYRTFLTCMVCLLTAMVALGQNDRTVSSAAGDLYVISAKAGGVNYVEGKVAVERADGTAGYIVKGDELKTGDRVSTRNDSRAEILLNPGSFIRLDHDSSFEFMSTSLDDLQIRVNNGSAIFEVYASDDFKVTVDTPKGRFFLIDTGVYRIDVANDGVARIEVRRGKALVDDASADSLKKGRTAVVDGDEVSVAKFDRGDEDDFETWSEDRAKLIAKANKKLVRERLEDSILGSGRVFDCYNSFGLWVYSPRYRSHVFLPYGYGWRSPYGFGLNTSTGICDYPYYDRFYRPGYRYPRSGQGGGGTGGGSETPTEPPTANRERAERNRTPPLRRTRPPFREMESSGNVETRRRVTPGVFPTFPSPSAPPARVPQTTQTTQKSESTSQPARVPRPPLSRSPSRKDDN